MAQSDVQVLTVNDENASDDDRLVTAARPDTSATMANTTFAGGAARNVIVTTTGTGDNAKTCTITVTAGECSAQYAANIKVGSGTLCAQAIGGGARARLKGMSIVSGGTAGTISLINGTPESGTALLKARTIGTANTVIDRTIPANGVLFANGISVSYTLDHADMMTFFFA